MTLRQDPLPFEFGLDRTEVDIVFFFSSRRLHTRSLCDWSSDVCSSDLEGRGRSQDQMVQEFAAITLTQPDKAAEIIHHGVEQGKARILVGPDAYLFDTLGRLAPTRYYDLLGRLESVLRRRNQANAATRSDGVMTAV